MDVNPEGPAYLAGLREGDKILSEKHGKKVSIPVELEVEDASGQRKTIRYFPENPNKVHRVPVFILDEEAYRRDPHHVLEFFQN